MSFRIIRRVSEDETPTQNPAVGTVRLCAGAFVRRGDSAVLLICRRGSWSMPGGGHELGESLSDTAIRHTRQETGIGIGLTGLVGIFIGPDHAVGSSSGNEVRQRLTIVYRAEPVAVEPTPSSESSRVEWVPSDVLAALPMNPGQREYLDWALTQSEPHIDVPLR